MSGSDWAYDTLVHIALVHSKQHVKLKAQAFRKEVLGDCIMSALVDIEWPTKPHKYAYEIVRDVCTELTKETN